MGGPGSHVEGGRPDQAAAQRSGLPARARGLLLGPSALQRLVAWGLRVTWAVLAFTTGPAVANALDARSRPVQVVASVGLWAVWAAVLAASLVPHPVSLTVVRCAAPGAALVAVAVALAGHGSPVSVSTAALAMAVAFLPETGTLFVNGPAYPNERRFLLRAPAPLLLGVLGVVWALALAPPVAGLMLLAARRWVVAGVVLTLAVPVTVVLLRAMHGLSRRWVVFVPAGLVIHDPITLADPVLFRRQVIASLGPAPADTDALDLTQAAPGLALELVLAEEVPLLRTRPGRRQGEPATTIRLMFTPTRPGAVLREAVERKLPVADR